MKCAHRGSASALPQQDDLVITPINWSDPLHAHEAGGLLRQYHVDAESRRTRKATTHRDIPDRFLPEIDEPQVHLESYTGWMVRARMDPCGFLLAAPPTAASTLELVRLTVPSARIRSDVGRTLLKAAHDHASRVRRGTRLALWPWQRWEAALLTSSGYLRTASDSPDAHGRLVFSRLAFSHLP